jgi:hypothetical protein
VSVGRETRSVWHREIAMFIWAVSVLKMTVSFCKVSSVVTMKTLKTAGSAVLSSDV